MAIKDAGQRPGSQMQIPGSSPNRRSLVPRWLGVLLLLLALLLILAAVDGWLLVGQVQQQSYTIPASGIRNATVNLNLGAGTLHLGGNAATRNAVEAHFDYNTSDITWDESHIGGQLSLIVGQKSGSVFNPFNHKNDWTIRLGRQLPVDLAINSGAGTATLDLTQVDLRSLTVSAGAGSTSVDLRRAWTRDLNVSVHGGVGETTIDLPTAVGVRVHVHSGLGSTNVSGLTRQNGDYVNAQYGRSPVTLNVSVDQGVGSINLRAG